MKFEIEPLVHSILDKLPDSVWSSDTTTFFDPALGGGQFVREIERRLRLHGHDDANIKNRVFGFEESNLHIRFAVNKYKLAGQYARMEYKQFFLMDTTVKFDVIVSNPAYKGQAQLHQQFFNKSVELVKDDGVVLFIHPSTIYFNKKEETQKHTQLVRDNIKKYKTSVEFVNPKVFENANVFNDLAITHLVKTASNPEIDTVMYSSGTQYHNVKLEDVTKTEMEPILYSRIVKKYKDYVSQHGSILDVATDNPKVKKAKITTQRGNIGGDDWYTFMPASKKYWVNHGDFGIPAKTDAMVQNIYDYLSLNFTRFGLAIYKFAGDLHGGAMGAVPLVPFDKRYTDDELYNLIGLTQDERDAINKFLPDYYNRYS